MVKTQTMITGIAWAQSKRAGLKVKNPWGATPDLRTER